MQSFRGIMYAKSEQIKNTAVEKKKKNPLPTDRIHSLPETNSIRAIISRDMKATRIPTPAACRLPGTRFSPSPKKIRSRHDREPRTSSNRLRNQAAAAL